jgi:uncharacterized protein (UPF0333 family)
LSLELEAPAVRTLDVYDLDLSLLLLTLLLRLLLCAGLLSRFMHVSMKRRKPDVSSGSKSASRTLNKNDNVVLVTARKDRGQCYDH